MAQKMRGNDRAWVERRSPKTLAEMTAIGAQGPFDKRQIRVGLPPAGRPVSSVHTIPALGSGPLEHQVHGAIPRRCPRQHPQHLRESRPGIGRMNRPHATRRFSATVPNEPSVVG